MKKLFLLAVVGLVLFEAANVYFIMPMPGSQRMRSLDLAYAVYTWRWPVRVALVLIAVGAWVVARRRGERWAPWLAPAAATAAVAVAYVVNFRMAADHMFLQPTRLEMRAAPQKAIAKDRLVVGVEINGDARAYPLQLIGYHHQVRDTVGGEEVLVSYCTVCRTGRVFSPMVNGKAERFRLVGMDRFNAMFEDESTGSWWRQANGEAVTGPRKGTALREYPSVQLTLERWLRLHPTSRVMQPDPVFADEYAKDYAYEKGTSTKKLTGTDTASWREKSWVVGIALNGRSKAYDWNRLKRERVVNDEVGGTPIVLALASDNASYVAFQRPDAETRFTVDGDSLRAPDCAYDFAGRAAAGAGPPLRAIVASQEFWHSWLTFQPATERY